MAKRNYWLDLFTGVTWQEFKAAGGKISGFRESRWSTVQKVKPGDYYEIWTVLTPSRAAGKTDLRHRLRINLRIPKTAGAEGLLGWDREYVYIDVLP